MDIFPFPYCGLVGGLPVGDPEATFRMAHGNSEHGRDAGERRLQRVSATYRDGTAYIRVF